MNGRDVDEKIKTAIELAVRKVNLNRTLLPKTKLELTYQSTQSPLNTFEHIQNSKYRHLIPALFISFFLYLKGFATNFFKRLLRHMRIILVILLVKKGYGLVSAFSQPYRFFTRRITNLSSVSFGLKNNNQFFYFFYLFMYF